MAKRKRKKSHKLVYILIVAVLLAGGAGLFFQLESIYYRERFSELDLKIDKSLQTMDLPILSKKIGKAGFFPRYPQAEEIIEIPFDYPLDELPSRIKRMFSSKSLEVQRIKEQNLKDTYQILVTVGFGKKITHILRFFLRKIKIALLIDDFGYSQGTAVDIFLKELNVPLTVSIIPGTSYAKSIAKIAHSNGKEVTLHLPMEPKGKFNNEYKWIILSGMHREEIENTTRQAIRDVPYCVGLNNHMGSLVTSKERIMQPLLEVVKKERLYFVDSRTTPDSIAFTLAKKMGVKSAYREIFLDNEKENGYIKRQFQKLILIAKKEGRALGIAHSNPVTAQALKEVISRLENRKIELVYVSEIVN
ncbi:hypothetical protein DRZ78_01875 [Candidatus Aerophobetes bacterium]|uniref:Divergent polysaccharide deacetylase family protein n=1 Tax=Aerophobetes bacterium TaxID=2030807 RepID=A0A662D5N8_UNCAE|nr:MAG: hypothetical protein DRZ78_01875 [Candidatus Aerophobetes bacterium]